DRPATEPLGQVANVDGNRAGWLPGRGRRGSGRERLAAFLPLRRFWSLHHALFTIRQTDVHDLPWLQRARVAFRSGFDQVDQLLAVLERGDYRRRGFRTGRAVADTLPEPVGTATAA